jgi:hypothetical protein
MGAPLAAARARRLARRLAPLLRAAYRHWQNLTPEEKERYKARARGYAGRGRQAYDRARSRGGPPRSK